MTHTTQVATVTHAADRRSLNILGHAVQVQLARKDTAGHYYAFEVVTPPGLGIPPHVHEREDEVIHVLEGRFAIRLGDQNVVASAGATIYFPKHIPHAFQNIGSGAGRTFWTVVPGGNFEDFFDRLDALPPGPPDPAKVQAIFSLFGMTILG